MTDVALLRCTEYSKDIIKDQILKGLSDIGFDPESFKDSRVALKPNLLMPTKPERAVITHPEFFRAVAEIVVEYSGIPVIIESPNFFPLASTMKKSGYMEIAEDLGIEVADNTVVDILHYEDAQRFKRHEISKAFFDTDFIINMPKFKTHAFAYVTCAVKNLFGAIPGLKKSQMHAKVPDPQAFSEYLLDLNGALLKGFQKPKTFLHIMDGITGMEGEGPGPSGTPKEFGAILVSRDAVALDYVATTIAGLQTEKAMTIQCGFQRDYFISSPDEITVKGETVEEMTLEEPFVPSGHVAFGGIVWPLTSKTVKNLMVERPVPDKEKCSLCYYCKTVCPVGAISSCKPKKQIPEYNYRECIRCLCCMETCPESALSLKKGKLQWLLRL